MGGWVGGERTYTHVAAVSQCSRPAPLHCAPQDAAEFGRIGKYYAVESMLVWDPVKQVCVCPRV